MTQEELNTILEKHRKWLSNDEGGVRADFSGMNLRRVNFDQTDLRDAIFRGAVLCNASFRHACLYGVDFRDAELQGANLRGAGLCDAILRNGNFCNTNLRDVNLYKTDLRDVDFRYADLRGANLCCTDLYNADLLGAVLFNADLCDAKNIPFIPLACPEEGSFIGFKRACGNTIIKLEIPADAKRSSATTRKCRCNKAKVLSIQNLDGTISNVTKVASHYDPFFIYEIGKTVEVKDFDEDRWNECSTGIHFFINRQEAVDYYLV